MLWRFLQRSMATIRTCSLRSEGLDISRLESLFPTQYDVGVDNNDYAPISYREVKSKIAFQKTKFEASNK